MNNSAIDPDKRSQQHHETVNISTDEELSSDPEKDSMLDMDIMKNGAPDSLNGDVPSKIDVTQPSTPSLNDFQNVAKLTLMSFKGSGR